MCPRRHHCTALSAHARRAHLRDAEQAQKPSNEFVKRAASAATIGVRRRRFVSRRRTARRAAPGLIASGGDEAVTKGRGAGVARSTTTGGRAHLSRVRRATSGEIETIRMDQAHSSSDPPARAGPHRDGGSPVSPGRRARAAGTRRAPRRPTPSWEARRARARTAHRARAT
jgi:hypothetical protein